MIDQFNAVKSCLEKLKTYADVEGYRIAIDGKEFEPEIDEIWLKESFLTNDNSQGVNNNCVQIQLPIYQININTPKAFGKWKALEVFKELSEHFERGTDISLDAAQTVTIERVDYRQLSPTDAHNVYAASVYLRCVG